MADTQLAFFDMAAQNPRTGAWVRPCGYGGPYAVRRPTPGNPGRLEVVTCTRPEAHDGPWHMYAELDRGVVCTWDRGGRPVWPPVLKGGA